MISTTPIEEGMTLDPSIFVDPIALAIVIGGTIGATMLRGPFSDSVRAFRVLPRLFRSEPFDFADARAEIAAFDRISGRKGLLALDRERTRDPDVGVAIAAIVDFASPDTVENLLARARAQRVERHHVVQEFWAAAAEAAPAMGMIGTLFGLVRMFARMEDPATIGASMAVALLSTLYGALVANLVAAPIAARLHRLSRAEELAREALVAPLKTLATRQEPVRPSHAA